MNFFQNVLAKAKKEGKLDPSLLPWEGSTWEVGNIDQAKAQPQVPDAAMPEAAPRAQRESFLDHLNHLPPEVLYDYQRIVENLRVMVSDNNTRVIGVASAIPGQGTSTLASVLATLVAGPESSSPISGTKSAAAKRKSVPQGALLVDTQFKHPSLHKIFDLPNDYGICELLDGSIPLNVSLNAIPGYGLKVVTTGRSGDFSMTQAHSQRFATLLEQLHKPYEFVFVDVPPILKYAEGIILSKLCDAVVLVVGSGLMRREEVQETREILSKAKVTVLGGILNRHKEYLPKGLSGRF